MGGAESGTEKSGLEHFLKISLRLHRKFFFGKIFEKKRSEIFLKNFLRIGHALRK